MDAAGKVWLVLFLNFYHIYVYHFYEMTCHIIGSCFFPMPSNVSNVDKLSHYNKKCRPTETVYYYCYYVSLFKVLPWSGPVNWQPFIILVWTNNIVLSELNWKGMNLKSGDKWPFKSLKICESVKSTEAAVRRCSSK